MGDDELRRWWAGSGIDVADVDPAAVARAVTDVTVLGADPVVSCQHRIGDGAAAALALVGMHAGALHHGDGGPAQAVRVDVADAAATLLGFAVQQADGVDLARQHNATIAAYPTADGRWIHLHGGFAHLAVGLVDLLGLAPSAVDDPDAVADAVARHDGAALEDAIAARGLCAALVRSPEQWAAHPQGAHLAALPAVTVERIGDGPPRRRPEHVSRVATSSGRARPLDGLRVLDLTRVLAGPTCGRTLASLGAQVLRVGAARLGSIEPFVVDTGHGKRNAFIDLDTAAGRAVVDRLVDDADVIVQGYRPGALDRFGLAPARLAERRPGIVVVQVSCYGSTGPWAERRGWEQLAQATTGMSWVEGAVGAGGAPKLVPAAATDYTTGYLAAAGVLAALRHRTEAGGSWLVRASLCQTAQWFASAGLVDDPSLAAGLGDVDARLVATDTAWGRLRHLPPALELSATPCRWDRPPEPLGTSPGAWW
ncbi:MAG: CoA transferase [Acidimicrobiales bacterium]|nr:CoA transferase [Acidimicrobiales bacterium]